MAAREPKTEAMMAGLLRHGRRFRVRSTLPSGRRVWAYFETETEAAAHLARQKQIRAGSPP